MSARVVVLASGAGSLFQALLDSPARGRNFEIVALVTDQPTAPVRQRAHQADVPAGVLQVTDFADRAAWDRALAEILNDLAPDLIVSAGFMRLLGSAVLDRFEGRIINTHPALLPSFPGAHAVRDALAAGATETGSTVHYIDHGVDTGRVIVQQSVPVLPGDDESTLHERIKLVERDLLERVVIELSSQAELSKKGATHG